MARADPSWYTRQEIVSPHLMSAEGHDEALDESISAASRGTCGAARCCAFRAPGAPSGTSSPGARRDHARRRGGLDPPRSVRHSASRRPSGRTSPRTSRSRSGAGCVTSPIRRTATPTVYLRSHARRGFISEVPGLSVPLGPDQGLSSDGERRSGAATPTTNRVGRSCSPSSPRSSRSGSSTSPTSSSRPARRSCASGRRRTAAPSTAPRRRSSRSTRRPARSWRRTSSPSRPSSSPPRICAA